MMKKLKWYVIILIFFALAGYSREFFFVQMNNILYMKYHHKTTTLAVAPVMTFFKQFSYTQLYYSKYFFTLLSFILFFTLNYLAVIKLTSQPSMKRLVILSFMVLLILGTISQAWGYFLNSRLQDDEYTFSRWLMGIAQSPIICLILVASEKLYHKTSQS